MPASTENIRTIDGTYNDAFYWERIDRSLGWLGDSDAEARERQIKLRDATIGMAGTGGIGGSSVHRLIRMGALNLKLADCDEFDATNMQRQVGADLDNLGRNKAEVIAEMAKSLTGDAHLEVFSDGITEENADAFVDGCDIVLDQIDVYSVKAHYALHRAFRKHPECKCIITVLTVGHAAYVFKYTHDSMPIEEVYGIPDKDVEDLTEGELRTLLGRLVPIQPDYPSRETFDRWFVDNQTVAIWAGTPPLCEGVLVERTAIELMDIPNAAPIPVQPGYVVIDTKNLTISSYSGAWWDDPQHQRQD